ncbi:MAG: Na/Pi cotransporter family protein [Spirochaetales bacterium]|nr:Na/Pi cotransporter family protein [Spirochaetales bacterium]
MSLKQEVFMPFWFKTLFGLLGGLAIFIYGMNLMSEKLQKVAGSRMKKILEIFTKNPFLGVVSGALVTAVLQSSSATTVMAIGFVSAGLMGLPQAISIIFGANIGTTITAQIVAFKISNYIYLFIFVGFAISFIVKNQKVKDIGMTIFAFGLLFLGIETMGSVMKPLAKSEYFAELIKSVADIPVLGVLTGTFMTAIVQSSSATIAVLQNLASQAGIDGSSILGLKGSIPILFGDNIGTTITAILACIGQSRDSKRTAIAHTLFNVSGTLLFFFFIPYYAKFIQWISPKGNEIAVISRQIANAHTVFNITMSVIWLPLLPFMVKIVKSIIQDSKQTSQIEFKIDSAELKDVLNYRLLNNPDSALALTKARTEQCLEWSKIVKNKINDAEEKNESFDQEIIDDALSLNKSSEYLKNFITALIAKDELSSEQAVECEEIIIKLHKIEKKLRKALRKTD